MNQRTIALSYNPLVIALTVAAFLTEEGYGATAFTITDAVVAGEDIDALTATVRDAVESVFPADEEGRALYFGPHPSLPDGDRRFGLWHVELRDQITANRAADAERDRKRAERSAAKLAEAERKAKKEQARLATLEARVAVEQAKLEKLRAKAAPAPEVPEVTPAPRGEMDDLADLLHSPTAPEVTT